MPYMTILDPARVAEPLHTLGILDDADLSTIETFNATAHRARVVVANLHADRTRAILDAGKTASTATDTAAAITKAAAKVPSDTVGLVAEATENAALQAARDVILTKRGQIPAAISAEYDAIREAVIEQYAALEGATTAAEAIDNDTAAAWRELTVLRNEANDLDELVTQLRFSGVIPTSGGADYSWAWGFRRPPDDAENNAACVRDDGSGVLPFVVATSRGRYVPASRDEVQATLAAAESVAA